MSIRKYSAVRHISWAELEEMTNSIAGQLRFGPRVQIITPIDDRAAIPSHMIAYKLGAKVATGGTTFGITSELKPHACFFQLEYENEFFMKKAECRIETIPVDIEGEYQRFTMPWEK